MPASVDWMIALAAVLEVEVERRLDLQPAAERLAGAVAVDQLLAQPGGEVRRRGVLGRRRDLLRGRDRHLRCRLRVLLVR